MPSKGGLEPVEKLKRTLEEYFSKPVFPINSGRSAIYLILKAAGIGEGDEVLIQAYTCNAVPNPIVWTLAKPVYADIDANTLNVDVDDLNRKISEKTRAIILQHTFGRPGPIEQVLKIAKEKKLLIIEDCAHSLGGTYKGKKLGTYADAAILSFGREKVISSLAGGAIIVDNQNLEKPLVSLISNLKPLPAGRLISELANFFTWRTILRKIYFNKTGYGFIKKLNEHDFFNVVISRKEHAGERPPWYPGALPNTFAQIALEEFANLEKYNQNRREIADFYLSHIRNPNFKLLSDHEGVYLRVVALHNNAPAVLTEARKRHFWFGNWYNAPVYPNGVDEEKLGYTSGSCPVAEECASKTLNLPNYLGMTTEDATRVVDFINNFY
jgi:dTDP-4-amino-4,6-dideoxygalactose transaminase